MEVGSGGAVGARPRRQGIIRQTHNQPLRGVSPVVRVRKSECLKMTDHLDFAPICRAPAPNVKVAGGRAGESKFANIINVDSCVLCIPCGYPGDFLNPL